MDFTSIHRALGVDPQPLTDDLLNDAVSAGVVERDDLDWKSQLPPKHGLSQTDFPKDIAAMANSGGGIIIYGVTETQKAATGRADVGEFDEGWERAMRHAAVTAISPLIFGLKISRLGTESAENRAVTVDVTASADGPHLIYRNELFGAPLRNNADTVWMKERQIETMYRARFDQRRHAFAALDALVIDAASGRDAGNKAWFVAAAHPIVPRLVEPLRQDEAQRIVKQAIKFGQQYADSSAIHPLMNVNWASPHPGLRRWVAVNATGESQLWQEAWASIHHNGSVTLAAAVGGHMQSMGNYLAGHQVQAVDIEGAVADLMALIRTAADSTGNGAYDVRVGIEWVGDQPLQILTLDGSNRIYDGVSTPLHRFAPVEMSVDAGASDINFHKRLYDLARDCINQGGVSNLRAIRQPPA